MRTLRRTYPFSALVGQENLKIAYLVNIINPHIGGLLISGQKGSGKSTFVHSVEYILPEYSSVKGCIFNCNPDLPETYCSLCLENKKIKPEKKRMKIVNLPLSCTEDRLIGSIDIEKLLKEGKKVIQPGILGEANRNILYVDEVNLLPDHLVDDILDSAASHWNTIEREGISISHPADFVLVGTMNPEEGELRPQILDRFSISVNVKTIMDKELRAEIVKRNILFEENPEEFYDIFREEDDKLKEVIISAKEIFPDVEIDNEHIYAVSGVCAELKVDGQRPDIVITKTARTIASLKQRDYVNNDDILLAAEFTLMHRTRDGGLLEPPEVEEIRKVFSNYLRSIPKRVDQRESEQKKSDSKDINKETGSLDFVKNIKFKKEVSKSQVRYVSANGKKK